MLCIHQHSDTHIYATGQPLLAKAYKKGHILIQIEPTWEHISDSESDVEGPPVMILLSIILLYHHYMHFFS